VLLIVSLESNEGSLMMCEANVLLRSDEFMPANEIEPR
jgi:hypothetical protein